MSIFIDCDEEVSNRWGGRHSHRYPLMLKRKEITKAHAVIFHDDVEGLGEGSRRQVWEFGGGVFVGEEHAKTIEACRCIDVCVHRDSIICEDARIWW